MSYDGAAVDTHVQLRLDEAMVDLGNTQAVDVADERVATVVARAAELGLPVLFDAYSPFDANQPGKFVRLAMERPEARIILAHDRLLFASDFPVDPPPAAEDGVRALFGEDDDQPRILHDTAVDLFGLGER